MFLAKQNLPFRVRREHMLSENKGNFLQLIELLSKYDPVLREHLIKLEQSTRSQSVSFLQLTEIPRLKRFLKAARIPKEVSLGWTSLRFLEFVAEYELFDSVPNLTLELRFFLCVSVASSERSFSKPKLIKNDLRFTLNQARLSSLAILSIENNVAEGINFDDAISKFAEQKVGNKRF
ncbi:hypothetical protein AVEN_15191-1 [Araneus ventricosus]|uniref:HAT C-terminal dimerisation domain-containing protein n=1 Tax=Araneus ventricosus TaxID=182803 RepID=A0A4Y2QIM7_ARAVE|nr:hypothetical protein AVEN_15191-1 [Araneus ventricosus]